ncbi:MAG: hypothetical protein M3O30_04015 [Planctomycetota bacterium]|nr:hypothetical protein [Planctomycetota bacterium]
MPRFIFKLEGLLRQRKNIEAERQRDVVELGARLAALDAELRALDSSARVTDQDMRDNRLLGKLDLSFLAAHRRYTLSMQRKAMGIAEKMAAAQALINEARKKLIDAARQRKIVEKLRERQLNRWKEAIARGELAALDEVGMQLAYRQLLDDRGSDHAQIDFEAQAGMS